MEPPDEERPTVTQTAGTRGTGPAGGPTKADPHEAGATFGRYVLQQRVGAGGMGEVWAAFDPELNRRVAIKLVRHDRVGTEGRQLLQREAQAMARLSHPNVVVVHDVGVVGEQTYVAMEFIEGPTLAQWMEREHPRPRRVLEAFIDAGRGLAAAHAAGIIHRDFKAGNVMIGVDGRVRVTDFGLARLGGTQAGGELGAGTTPPGEGAATAAFFGTPRYMAPEQHRGEPADARSDQFSFCTALFEALYGGHPFAAGASSEDLRQRVLAGHVAEPRSSPGLPASVRRAIQRGLAVDPGERHPDMASLLRVLARDPHRLRRRMVLGSVVVASVVGIAFGLAQVRERRRRLCSGGEAAWDAVWGLSRRQGIEEAFRRSGAPFATDAARQVVASLDGYRTRWVASYRSACEATRVRGEQSEQMLDREVSCLGRGLKEADALVSLLMKADAERVAAAAEALSGLRPASACTDVAALGQETSRPLSGEERRRAEALETRLAEAEARKLVGRYDEALDLARSASAEAAAASLAQTEGAAQRLVGELLIDLDRPDEAEKALRAGLASAERIGSDRAAAAAAKELIWLEAVTRNRFAEADRWWEFGQAKLQRLGGGEDVEEGLLTSRAAALSAEGKYAEAARMERRNLEIAEKRDGPESFSAAVSHNQLGQALDGVGDYAGALEHLQRSAGIKERVLGPRHPVLAYTLSNLGSVLSKVGRHEEAIAAHRRALAIQEQAFGRDSPVLGVTLNNLAYSLEQAGRLTDALQVHDRTLALTRAHSGEDDPQTAYALLNRVSLFRKLGRYDDALADARRAERILAAALGRDHPNYAFAANAVGFMLTLTGRPAEGLPHLERALAIRRASATEPLVLASTEVNVAKALWGAKADPVRSRALLRSARATFVRLGDVAREDLALMDAWLAENHVRLAD
ncbi:MAG TPA: serine/threonine-protein kinase [Vicinamibacteria bacterium]|nr:serine/threonine-protein kinase [Vicinamibacteria bacterium]